MTPAFFAQPWEFNCLKYIFKWSKNTGALSEQFFLNYTSMKCWVVKNSKIFQEIFFLNDGEKIPAGSGIVLLSNLVKCRARHRWQLAAHMEREGGPGRADRSEHSPEQGSSPGTPTLWAAVAGIFYLLIISLESPLLSEQLLNGCLHLPLVEIAEDTVTWRKQHLMKLSLADIQEHKLSE